MSLYRVVYGIRERILCQIAPSYNKYNIYIILIVIIMAAFFVDNPLFCLLGLLLGPMRCCVFLVANLGRVWILYKPTELFQAYPQFALKAFLLMTSL